jgi:TonB-linked SusC/RagA family outer membrane protein
MKGKLLLSTVLVFSMIVSFAQTTIKGKVTSADDGSGLPGVTVQVKGTNTGTQTNADGNYTIVASGTSTLEFTFIGFKTFETVVGNRTQIDIALESDVKTLSEVVVTGFGSQIKRELTGNIAQVKGKDIENMPTPSVDAALQGKAAGVYVNSGSGKLGQAVTVRVRGNSSISASSEPLYVVDGMPVTTGDLGNYGGNTNPLVDLNPNDIESIEILKDASAGAIYGSRAANGVVLITTKRGGSGKTNISFNYQTGVSEATKRVAFLNAQQFIDFYKQATANRDRISGYDTSDPDSYTQYMFGPGGFLEYYSMGTYGTPDQGDYNWQDQAFQQGGLQQADFQMNGGNEKTKFFISGQYYDQTGTIIGNSLNRMSGRLNLDHKATNWLNVGLSMNLTRSFNRRLPGDNAFSNPLQMSALTPLTPFTDKETGLPTGTPPGDASLPLYFNPIIAINYAKYTSTGYRNLSNAYAQVKLLPGLLFRSELGIDLLNQNEEGYWQSQNVRNNSDATSGNGVNYGTFVTNYNTNNFFSYDKTLGVHGISAVLGMSYQESQTKRNYVSGIQFPSDSYQKIASAATKNDGSSSETNFRFLSYFLRANYKFADKYLFSASGRIDGSSRFGSNARYGFFPAASVGWVISEEGFLKDNSTFSFLKLRGSYGLVGNAEIGDFPQLGLFQGDAGYAGTAGQRPAQIGNPDLKWETTAQADIGIDFGFFKNRINGEIDYYEKKTSGLLLNVNIPATSGFSTQVKNVGKLENKGFEFVLNTQNLVGDFKWNTTLNFSTNKNKVTDIDGQIIEGGVRSMNRVMEGEAIGVFYTREYAGVNPANGDALFYKNTKGTDGAIDRSTVTNAGYNSTERVVVGNPNPKFIGGITNNFSYKGIDLSVFFNGVAGNDINIYGIGQYSSANGIYEDNQTADQMNAWTPENPNTNVPEARFYRGNGNQASSRYIVDGSFVRLRTATLGYTLPKALTSKMKIEKLRVYVSGMNLATFTSYPLWDPEVNSDDFTSNFAIGNDFYTPPQPRSFIVGLNLGF